MPKAIQYRTGSIIYFEGDNDDRIFILQKGTVVLKSTDIETGAPINETIAIGEFFGVKSAFGHFPREETVSVMSGAQCVALTVPEFEHLFGGNKAVILKMLKVFSNQLRNIHKKIDSILDNKVETYVESEYEQSLLKRNAPDIAKVISCVIGKQVSFEILVQKKDSADTVKKELPEQIKIVLDVFKGSIVGR